MDVYSVGLVFWEILQWHQPVKRYPFEGMNEHVRLSPCSSSLLGVHTRLLQAIYDSVGQKNIRPSTASIGRTWGAEILNLINVMWQGSTVWASTHPGQDAEHAPTGDQSLRPDMTQVVFELGLIKAALAPEEKKSRR